MNNPEKPNYTPEVIEATRLMRAFRINKSPRVRKSIVEDTVQLAKRHRQNPQRRIEKMRTKGTEV